MESEVRDLRLRTGITVPCFAQGDADAKPVLLLHAWAESRGSFDRLVPHLTGFRVYAPDLHGQGEADKPEDGYSLAEQAEDAAAILDTLNVPTAFVVGSSSGGYIAQQLAIDHPEKVAALVLVGSPLSLHGRSQDARPSMEKHPQRLRRSHTAHRVGNLWECPDQVAEDATSFFRSLD
jgi:pimeloyl-ACP methyl ester carboxylesterase